MGSSSQVNRVGWAVVRVCAAAINSSGTPGSALTVMGGIGVAVGVALGMGVGVGRGDGVAEGGMGVAAATATVAATVGVGVASGLCPHATNPHSNINPKILCFIMYQIMSDSKQWSSLATSPTRGKNRCMVSNIIFFVGVSSLLWLIWRYGVTPSRPRTQSRYLALFAVVGSVFLLANALFAAIGYTSLGAAANLIPLTSLPTLADKRSGDPVIIVGKVSQDNPLQTDDYVAYTDCDDDTCFPYRPSELLIRVDGGNIIIHNNNYEAREWPVDFGVTYLSREQPVVVVGTAFRNQFLTGEQAVVTVQADILFAGTHDAFVKRARSRQIAPLILIGLNLFAAAAGLFIAYSLFSPKPQKQVQS